MIEMGGLGQYLIEGKFESWTCVFDDAYALGGDYYFCYVFQETTMKFIPSEQHGESSQRDATAVAPSPIGADFRMVGGPSLLRLCAIGGEGRGARD